jgi:hypothetical protein
MNLEASRYVGLVVAPGANERDITRCEQRFYGVLDQITAPCGRCIQTRKEHTIVSWRVRCAQRRLLKR